MQPLKAQPTKKSGWRPNLLLNGPRVSGKLSEMLSHLRRDLGVLVSDIGLLVLRLYEPWGGRSAHSFGGSRGS